MAFWNLS